MKKQNGNHHNALDALFKEQLQDVYWAEKYLVKSLQKMASEATSDELIDAFEKHRTETQGHVDRLEKVFEAVGERALAKRCEAMDGLVKEAETLIADTENGSLTRDAALIMAAQKVEHYEIAFYGTLATMAGLLHYDEARKLLGEILQEEKKADVLLTKIAEGFVNREAMAEA